MRGFRLQAEGCEVANIWLTTCRRFLRRHARIGLASLVLRPARLAITPTHVDVFFQLNAADVRIRRAGLDVDPGWVPWFRRVVAFHYGRSTVELIAPRVAAPSSLGALAFAALSPAGPAPDNVPEAQWLAAHREGRETWLEDLPAAFAAWLKDPPPEDRRLVALASAIGLTRAETLAVALSRAAETDAMAGRVLAWLQTPVGGTRPLAGLVASLAERFGDPAPLTSLAAGAARSVGLLQADNETRSMPERSLIVPQPIVLALADPPVLSWPGLRVGMPDPPPLPPSLREAAASRARALSRRAASGIVVRSGHPREAKAVAAEICLHLGARPLFLDGDPPDGLGPWLWLAAAIPVICAELAPGERRRLKDIPGWNGPVLVAAGPDGSFEREGEAQLEFVTGRGVLVPARDVRVARASSVRPLAVWVRRVKVFGIRVSRSGCHYITSDGDVRLIAAARERRMGVDRQKSDDRSRTAQRAIRKFNART